MREKNQSAVLPDANSLTEPLPNEKTFGAKPNTEPESLQSAVNWIEQDSAEKTEEYLESCNTRQSGE